jgi:hypothetical protein
VKSFDLTEAQVGLASVSEVQHPEASRSEVYLASLGLHTQVGR